MGKNDKSANTLAENGVELNPFGQYRSPAAACANLERHGEAWRDSALFENAEWRTGR